MAEIEAILNQMKIISRLTAKFECLTFFLKTDFFLQGAKCKL